jgi:flagellin-like hook-associated protein FlgL
MAEVSLSSSVRTNLLTLKKTSDQLETTTERLSSGKKVASAIDNPTNYFAAENYNDTADSLDGRLDGMSEATEQINAADNGITNIKAFLSQMEGVVNDALSNTDSDERASLGEQYNELIVQVRDMAKDSSYGGINLLYDNASTTVEFGESSGDSTLKLQGFNISAAAGDADANGEVGSSSITGVFASAASQGASATAADYVAAVASYNVGYALSIDVDGDDVVGLKSAGTDSVGTSGYEVDWGSSNYQEDLAEVITSIEEMDSALQTQSSKLANNLAIITQREDFTDEAINILQEGADNLTLADMNEEGANLLSLQTSNSLAVQSLSLASDTASNVLSLIQ